MSRTNDDGFGAKPVITGHLKYMALPHYVADGGNENIRQWRREEIDLREVYSHIWPDGAPAHLVDIAIFCDSDETHGHTAIYFAEYGS